MAKNLSQIFNQFVGQEVPLTQKVMGAVDHGCGEIEAVYGLGANDKDPVLQAMEQTATANGLKLAVSFPGGGKQYLYSMTTAEMFNLSAPQPDRVNATIEQAADGKYRVSSTFTLG